MEESKGSCCILIATDAPFLPRTLERFARRAVAGLVGTGSFISHGSGDYALAWSTAVKQIDTISMEEQPVIQGEFLSEYSVDPFFQAIVECVEESLWNSMTHSKTVEGHKKTIEGIPTKKVLELIGKV
jgi:D-aminopeptidase